MPPSPCCQRGLGRAATIAVAALLIGCGQKGPLMPPAPASAASAPAAAK